MMEFTNHIDVVAPPVELRLAVVGFVSAEEVDVFTLAELTLPRMERYFAESLAQLKAEALVKPLADAAKAAGKSEDGAAGGRGKSKNPGKSFTKVSRDNAKRTAAQAGKADPEPEPPKRTTAQNLIEANYRENGGPVDVPPELQDLLAGADPATCDDAISVCQLTARQRAIASFYRGGNDNGD